jgi:N-acetylmuramoyl-L-alanine amidase
MQKALLCEAVPCLNSSDRDRSDRSLEKFGGYCSKESKRGRRMSRLRVMFSQIKESLLGCSTGNSVKKRSLALPAASAAILAIAFPTAHAITVTTATHYWGTTVQGSDSYSLGYGSRDAAATGGAAYYCGIAANANFSCSYGGMDANGNVTLITSQGSYVVFYIYEFWSCNVGGQVTGQFFSNWNDNGTIYTPACVNWDTSPPPPPPPPPPKVVAVDPGHGFTCLANGMRIGAIGVTDFLPNDPPAGRLREDDLTMAIAREVQRLAPAKYKIVLTKSSAIACPSFLDRGRMANNANAKVFLAVHVDRPNPIPGNPFGNGSLGIYNSGKPAAKPFADLLVGAVSSNLGVNNRGSKIDDSIAVLKPNVTKMTAVILESARLSGADETKLHTAGSATRIAAAIIAALDAFLGN